MRISQNSRRMIAYVDHVIKRLVIILEEKSGPTLFMQDAFVLIKLYFGNFPIAQKEHITARPDFSTCLKSVSDFKIAPFQYTFLITAQPFCLGKSKIAWLTADI